MLINADCVIKGLQIDLSKEQMVNIAKSVDVNTLTSIIFDKMEKDFIEKFYIESKQKEGSDFYLSIEDDVLYENHYHYGNYIQIKSRPLTKEEKEQNEEIQNLKTRTQELIQLLKLNNQISLEDNLENNKKHNTSIKRNKK